MKCLRNVLRDWLGIDDLSKKLAVQEDAISTLVDDVVRLENTASQINGRLSDCVEKVDAMSSVFTEYFRVDADVGYRGSNTIVLTGIYRGKGYVQFYDVDNGHFKFLVERLRTMKKCNLIRTLDAPQGFVGSFDIK